MPRPKGRLEVNVELLLMPGRHVVDLSKVRGNTVDFYGWYADLTAAIDDIISKQHKPSLLSRPTPGAARLR